MKIYFLFILIFLVTGSYAQSKYETSMKTAIQISDSADSPSELLAISNRFERIAMAEKDKWLPYYYASMCQVRNVFMLQDKSQADILIDKAESLSAKADSINPGNSEISCLKSMIASCRMLVDPMSRYMTYGQVSAREIENAITQDSLNPRPYLLRGQGLRYTPEQFGGGCANALPHLEKAIKLFTGFNPQTDLHPSWGMNITRALLNDCK